MNPKLDFLFISRCVVYFTKGILFYNADTSRLFITTDKTGLAQNFERNRLNVWHVCDKKKSWWRLEYLSLLDYNNKFDWVVVSEFRNVKILE